MQISSFIDGNFETGSDSFFTVKNPFTSEELHKVQSCDLMLLVKALQAAGRAQAEWRSSNMSERLQLVRRIVDVLSERAEDYARLEALDQALPLSFVKQHGLQSLVAYLNELTANTESNEPINKKVPAGVTVIISSWNLSLRTIMVRLVPCLLSGNAAVVKVSSRSPVTAHILADIFQKIDLPKGLVNVLVTDSHEVTETMMNHPSVKAVCLSGQHETLLAVTKSLGRFSHNVFKKIRLSGGSKNSAVVLGDPDSVNFNQIMQSFMIGQGQLVWNSSRLFIIEKHEKQWLEKIQDYLQALRPSESIEDSSVWTPCLKKDSFDKFEFIKKQAFEDKAKLLQSGYKLSEKQSSNYLNPVFTQDMSRCSTLQQDQIHAPFFIVSTVKYPFDVPKYSNVSYYGFAAHLWGEPEKLNKIAEALDVGLIAFNKWSVETVKPVRAFKQSGSGIQNFDVNGDFFADTKTLV